ncbi:MAG: hypothetical protein EOM20_15005 [Spartobacteria bacterium]|nr:hypothetical protein [Spartobacteria bacterium]
MKKARYVALVLLILFVAGIIWGSRDIPPPRTDDLTPSRIELNDQHNAFIVFNALTNGLFYPEAGTEWIDEALDGADEHGAAMDELIARNAEAIALVKEGCERSRCVAPELRGVEDSMPYVGPWRRMARVLAVKARRERMNGEVAPALQTSLLLFRFGMMIQADANSVLTYRIGCEAAARGMQEMRRLLNDGRLTKTQLAELTAALNAAPPFSEGCVAMAKAEYQLMARAVDDLLTGKYFDSESDFKALTSLARHRVFSGYFIHPNRTKAMMADVYRKMIRQALDPEARPSASEKDAADAFGQRPYWRMLGPNVVGKILCVLLMPSVENTLQTQYEWEADLAAIYSLIAQAPETEE